MNLKFYCSALTQRLLFTVVSLKMELEQHFALTIAKITKLKI